jgi:hypothetical protein
MSTVDVIVPCYRYGHLLKECVESVLTQSGPSVRVLIIDDDSPDNTSAVAAKLAQEDPRVTVVRHSANRGHIATYNEGLDWAEADYLMLLSADDYLLPRALQRAVGLMDRYPEAGFAFGNAVYVDEQGTATPTDVMPCQNGERILVGQEFIVLSGARNIVPTPTAVVRTVLQKRVGGYRGELPHAGDMEMWLRLAAHASVGFIETPQAVYRRHANNMSLSFTGLCSVPDLEQRRLAFDYFFQACGHIVPNPECLGSTMLRLLARDAVGRASMAFNDGELEACNQLATFALQTYPRVTKSLPWAKLASKRRMGLRLWRALQPVADGIRWARSMHSRQILNRRERSLGAATSR